MAIATFPFGRSGHFSTRMLFDVAALGEVTQLEADRTLEVLLQYGVNHIDVAASYGEAELRLAPWLARHRVCLHMQDESAFPPIQSRAVQALHNPGRLPADGVQPRNSC